MSDEDSNYSSPSNERLSHRSKRPKSKFEEFFEIIHVSHTAFCKLCQHKKIEIKMKNRNTSGLRKHLISFHKKESEIFLPVKPKLSGDMTSFLVTAGRSGQIKMSIKNEKTKQDKGKVLSFDHLTFWVANAKTASSYFTTRFGFKPLAVRESSDDRSSVSYAVQLNKIIIIFESPTSSDGEIIEDLTAHGDFVKDVTFEVSNLDSIFQSAKEKGADVVKEITEERDENGLVRYAILRTYGDNTHTLIDRSKYDGVFLPGYKPLDEDPVNGLLPATNLSFVDHVEGNVADDTLEDSISWYEKNLNMRRFWCVDYAHDLVPFSSINSASVINENETVLLSLNEAASGKRASKASTFVSAHGTSGVEHVALYTDNIVQTMQSLKSRGADIVTWPANYYELIKEKLKNSSVNVTESIEELKENNILIDFDERGYMLQAFTKHLQIRPTLFIEIIQRRNHRGFGAMNYQWVFEAIERSEMKSDKES